MNAASEALERETVPCGICGTPTPIRSRIDNDAS